MKYLLMLFGCVFLLIAGQVFIVQTPAHAQVVQTVIPVVITLVTGESPTPTPTPNRTERPDSCEPNDTIEKACHLEMAPSEMSRVFGPFTFVVEDTKATSTDQDYYSVFLGEYPTGMDLRFGVRGSNGLTLRTSVLDPVTNEVLVRFEQEQAQIGAASRAGWLVLRVENVAPGEHIGESYTISLERLLPAPFPTPVATTDATTPTPEGWLDPTLPDRMENNWRYDFAPTIGINTVYDLNFVCPEPGKCEGGDHDWLRIPVKQGLVYMFATFDLAPGVDTSMAFYRLREDGTLEHLHFLDTDDFNPGHGFLSMRTWEADADSFIFVEIAPRYGGAHIDTSPSESGIGTVAAPGDTRYRFAAVLLETALGRTLLQRVFEQAEYAPPTPTAVPTAKSPVSAPVTTAPVSATDRTTEPAAAAAVGCAQGYAVLKGASTAYLSIPPTEEDVLTSFPEGTELTLMGSCYRQFVLVRVIDASYASATPLWMHTLNIRPLDTPGGAMQPGSRAPGAPGSTGGITATLRALTPMPPTATPTPAPRAAVVVPRLPDQSPTPTHAPPVAYDFVFSLCSIDAPDAKECPPLPRLKVEILNSITQQVLGEAYTDIDGYCAFSLSTPAATALSVRVGAAGILMPLNPKEPQVEIRIPRLGPPAPNPTGGTP